ncbi:MAG TPA: MFS transporter, partial [Chloroflexota bacterium]
TEKYGKKPVLNIGMLLFGAIALVGGTLVATVPQAMVMMSVVGIANAITTALIFPFLADLMPRERAGEFTGVGAMVWSISQTVGALGAGAVADATGTLRVSFALAGVFMLLASLLMLSVSRGRMRPVPNTLFTSFTTR